MGSFDEARYLRIQKGAVALAPAIHNAIEVSLSEGTDTLFFVGSGGAGILMQPAVQVLKSRTVFPVEWAKPAELIRHGSPRLGPNALIVMPSLSGTSSETLEALDFCKQAGATTISLTGDERSPLATRADVNLSNFAEDDTSCESFYLQSLSVALALLDIRREIDNYDVLIDEMHALPAALVELKRDFDSPADAIAEQLADVPWLMITGAGNTWPQAFYYGMCILEQMQWIKTRPIHSADFFHGALELVEEGVRVLLLKGEDRSRPLVERVERFVPRVNGTAIAIDAASLAPGTLSPALRELVSPVLLAAALERVSERLAILREHPLTTVRYYRQFEY